MSDPTLYPRKGTTPKPELKPYLLSWAEGSTTLAFREEASAIRYALYLTDEFGSVVTMTGPEHDYLACECGCGRLFRDGDGARLGEGVYAPGCPTYASHPAVIGSELAQVRAWEREDAFNWRRR